jgi:signal transduction histidine kinase
MIDRHKVMQILANLLSNAHHAMCAQAHGPKVLTVRLRPAPPGSFQIEVEDSGVGISEAVMGRLFEFGFTTRKDGHGFGLHSSAALAREMGGSLRAYSRGTGLGACFTLGLPMTRGEAHPRRHSA